MKNIFLTFFIPAFGINIFFLRKCYIGMKNDTHKLSIVILQELVGKKLRIENGEWKIENGKFQTEN